MWIWIPFIIQAVAMGFDEGYFHIKRGLPKWERIGHPLDTLSVLICLLFVICIPYSEIALKWYIGLSIFSCCMVTKDEWVHQHHCVALEQWLHAFLFLNHPIILTCIALIWKTPSRFNLCFLLGQVVFVTLFLLYQIIYWNILWKNEQQ